MASRDWAEHKTYPFSKHFPSGTLGQQKRKKTLYPFLMLNNSKAMGWAGQI